MSDTPPRPPANDPEETDTEPAQALGMFTEPTEPDVHLDPATPAFDRVQDGKDVDEEYEREYNRRYVKEHGDHHGHKSEAERDADRDAARGES